MIIRQCIFSNIINVSWIYFNFLFITLYKKLQWIDGIAMKRFLSTDENFEDTKVVIINTKLKKDKQYNGQNFKTLHKKLKMFYTEHC
jgi:hypothetical protein